VVYKETLGTDFRTIRMNLLPSCIWTGARPSSVDPLVAPSASPLLHRLVGGPWSYLLGVCRLVMLVWSVKWALLVSETQEGIFCAFLLHSLVFSLVFQLWVPANHNSPKLVEPIRIKLYS
jgi:hypothetical protein